MTQGEAILDELHKIREILETRLREKDDELRTLRDRCKMLEDLVAKLTDESLDTTIKALLSNRSVMDDHIPTVDCPTKIYKSTDPSPSEDF